MLEYTINGKEITIEQDYDGYVLELEMWEDTLQTYGIAIEPYDRNSRSFGDLELLKDTEDWEEDYNRLVSDAELCIEQLQGAIAVDDLEGVVPYASDLERAVEELAKHMKSRRPVYAFEYCPYVDLIRYFKVTVDCEKWLEAVGESELSEEMVKRVVRDFDTVYRGGVRGVEVEGQDPIYGVVFDDELPTENELRELFD